MGCWNGTCFLTQLPIRAGEKVRLVFITESPYKNLKESRGEIAGYCYVTDQYFPRGLPIRGEYNDYGGIENIDSSFALEHMLEAFKEDCVSIAFDSERDKYVDRNSLDPEKITIDYLLDRAGEGALSVYDGHSKKLSEYKHEEFIARIKGLPLPEKPIIDDRRELAVGYVLIREDMYQAVLNTSFPKTWWLSNKTITRETFYEDAKIYIEKLHKYKNEISELHVMLEAMASKGNVFMESLSKMSGIPFQRNLSDFDDFLHAKIEAGMAPDDPKIIALIYELADFMFFKFCLNNMRKGWCPQAGSGSQNDDVEAHAVLAMAVLKHVDKVREQQKMDEEKYQLMKKKEK